MHCSDSHRQHADAQLALPGSLSQMLGSGVMDRGGEQERREDKIKKKEITLTKSYNCDNESAAL